jgi:hypothetical protein
MRIENRRHEFQDAPGPNPTGLWAFAAAMQARWNVHVPIPADRIGSLPMVISNGVWILVALLFVFGGQFVVERTEM